MKNKKIIAIIGLGIVITLFLLIKNNKFIEKNNSYVVSGTEEENISLENNEIQKNNDIKGENINVNNIEDIKNNKSFSNKISIYISGAVNSPGVVQLKSNDRLIDGVNLCNGLTSEADTNRINLAIKVEDEGHYIIPKIGEDIVINDLGRNMENEEGNNSGKNSKKININNASKEELDSLPGVGEVTAQKILDYREENKEFKTIDEIKNVKGIGENKFNNLKDYICIQ